MFGKKKKQDKDEEELMNDVKNFNAELQPLLAKYKLGIRVILQSNESGIKPAFNYYRDIPNEKEEPQK